MLQNTITIWDTDSKNYKKTLKNIKSKLIMWNGYEESKARNYISILKVIDKNSFRYRKKYLKWTHSLNEIKFKNKELIDHFNIRSDFSFWSMSLFNEKCNFIKSPLINDAIKLIALEEFIRNKNIETIILYSSNKHLFECIKNWCQINKINFKGNIYKKESNNNKIKLSTVVFRKMPSMLKSILWFLHYIIKRWPLRGVGRKEWLNSTSEFIFASYLINSNFKKLNKGIFDSYFWGNLPENLDCKGFKTKWLHIWNKSDQLKTSIDVIKYIKTLNIQSSNNQCHVTLDSFLSIRVIYKTLSDWLYIIFKSLEIQKIFFRNYRKGFNLTLLQKEDWFNTIYGIDGIKSILFFNLLECAFKDLVSQKGCFYLQENQGWEFGLISAWKKTQKAFIFGVPHFTIRFWDLRYFFDKKYFKNHIKYIRPDKVLVNGPVAEKQLLEINYPKEELINVEALRYNYLTLIKEKKIQYSKKNEHFTILVLGDYDTNVTNDQFYVLENSLENLIFPVKVFFKPHPTFNNKNFYMNKIKLTFVKKPLKDVFHDIDLVLCGSNSSASVDSYCFGLPTAIHLNQKTLNLSPLKNIPIIDYYNNNHQLKKIIIKNFNYKNIVKSIDNYFYLDNALPRWMSIFNGLK